MAGMTLIWKICLRAPVSLIEKREGAQPTHIGADPTRIGQQVQASVRELA
jgi:hypothetical protein